MPTDPDRIRPAAVAGYFYPAAASELRRCVDDDLAAQRMGMAAADAAANPAAHALIVPHAGYVYSGRYAAAAYAGLRPAADTPWRVIIAGPSHRVAFHGIAVPTSDAFATPLGTVPIDRELRQAALALPDVVLSDAPHAEEHGIEVQLPFLQRLAPTPAALRILPLVVGQVAPGALARVLDALWQAPTLLVVSSDLSHYLSEAHAHDRDGRTCQHIVAGEADLRAEEACGATPINALLELAGPRGLQLRQLAYGTSADAPGIGDPRRVVGYAAFAAGPAPVS